jgi:Pyruvate/2-oxoglutarate dehydrogenase complex, dihydrolipoamide acyltransferase (E2) component, and related enzymes
MPKEFHLPEIAESVAEGEISRWLVKEGDLVQKEQPLVEVITDKVTVEIPSPFKGKILKILAKEGDIVKIHQPILIYAEEGEDERVVTAVAEEKVEKVDRVQKFDKETVKRGERVLAAPAVRKLAKSLGIDLSLVMGTGPGGRIRKVDVLKYYEESKKGVEVVKEEKEEVVVPKVQEFGIRRIPFRGIRRAVAEHLRKSKEHAVHAFHAEEMDFTEILKLVERVKPLGEREGVKISVFHLFLKAVVATLKKHPEFNGRVDDERGEILLYDSINISIAVDTPEGLKVPVIKNAEKKSVLEIAREVKDLAERARNNTLRIEDVTDGTFSVSNIGSIGGVFAYPVINYPEIAIIALPRPRKVPVFVGDEIKPRYMATIVITFDHRAVDGAHAARFLNDLKTLVENPDLLIINI